jgi:bifunctional non-homologous end joining protein LigD
MAVPSGANASVVEIDGRVLKLSNLDKVLYPEAGFTKGEVVDYYTRVAPVLLTHIGDRGISMHRYPNGVDDKSFWEKRCPGHRPEWMLVARGPGDRGGPIDYCRLAERASLAWAGNMAALELHSPMARAGDMETPTMVVFDLDPGPPAGMAACAEVGLMIHDVLDRLGLVAVAKTSGSKGLQLYVPCNLDGLTHDHAAGFALALAHTMEKHHPGKVLSNMRKDLRAGKVFIDWSQNSRHKTTVAPYSLRARPRPTVSTPVTWDEVEAAAAGEPLSFEAGDVLQRLAGLGDLFAPAATVTQEIPRPPPI